MATIPLSDPALDKPRLRTDMCRNVDLPLGAFAINHLVSWNFSTFHWALRAFILIPISLNALFFILFYSCHINSLLFVLTWSFSCSLLSSLREFLPRPMYIPVYSNSICMELRGFTGRRLSIDVGSRHSLHYLLLPESSVNASQDGVLPI